MTPETQAQLVQSSAGRLQITEAKTPLTVPNGAGFLYGDLAPLRTPMALARDFKMAIRLSSVLTLLIIVLAALQWGWLSWQVKKYRQNIESSFRIVSPQGAMVDALLQMRRQVDSALHAAGQLSASDFLSLLDALSGLTPNQGRIGELSFEKNRLRIAGEFTAQDLQALKQRCRQRGLTLTVLIETKQATSIRVDLEISEGSR